jgi:hypothetical protein
MVQIKLSVALILTAAAAAMAPVVARPVSVSNSITRERRPGPIPDFPPPSSKGIPEQVERMEMLGIPLPYSEVGALDRHASGSYFPHQPSPAQHPPASNSPPHPSPAQHPPASNSPPHPSTGQHPPASNSPGLHTASSETNRVRSVSTKLKAMNAFVSISKFGKSWFGRRRT